MSDPHGTRDGNPYAAPAPVDEALQLDEAMAVYDRHPRLAKVVGNNFAVYVGLWRLDRTAPGWPRPWHWPAFLFDFHWLLYRRMYLWAALFMLVSLIGGAVIALLGADDLAAWKLLLAMKLLLSVAANGLYLRRCRALIARVEAEHPGDTAAIDAALARRGGVSLVALAIGIAFSVALQAVVVFA